MVYNALAEILNNAFHKDKKSLNKSGFRFLSCGANFGYGSFGSGKKVRIQPGSVTAPKKFYKMMILIETKKKRDPLFQERRV
jgi:hypothetical protein